MTGDDSSAVLHEISSALYIVRINELLGSQGVVVLQRLMKAVHSIFRVVPVETFSKGLTVVISLYEDDIRSVEWTREVGFDVPHAGDLAGRLNGTSSVTIAELGNGTLRCWVGEEPPHDEQLLVYSYRGPGSEFFLAGGADIELETRPGFSSVFSTPYHEDLRDALAHYYLHCAQHNRCPILGAVWRGSERLVLNPKPEHHMRDSLVFFLRNTLRNIYRAEVMPEQNVDETKPVDVKVSWINTNRVALIEVKWLGGSAAVGATNFSSNYSASRAVEGARQLADYLDRYEIESPLTNPIGYLVVFDARRRGLTPNVDSLEAGLAGYFRHKEIDYPEDIIKRVDFSLPVRYFLEPA